MRDRVELISTRRYSKAELANLKESLQRLAELRRFPDAWNPTQDELVRKLNAQKGWQKGKNNE